MTKKDLIPCRCGAIKPNYDVDNEKTFIECKKCHRMCGGLTEEDAISMWNFAMKKSSTEKTN